MKGQKTLSVVVIFLTLLYGVFALTTVNIENPLSNSVVKGDVTVNATTDSTASNTTFEWINSSGTIVHTQVNDSAGTYFEITTDTLASIPDGVYSINATSENGTGAVVESQETNVTVDNNPPTINSVDVAESDIYYSNVSGSNIINLRANVTDTVGVERVDADFSDIQGGGIQQMVFNSSTGLYETNFTVTNADYNFDNFTLNVTASDNASNTAPASQFIVRLHNVSIFETSHCVRFGTNTTDFRTVEDFGSVPFRVVMETNGSASCPGNPPMGLPWGNSFKQTMSMNMSGANFSSQSSARKLTNSNVDPMTVNIAPPNTHQQSRIFVNSTFFSELSQRTSLTLYGLPFASQPNVVKDEPEQNVTSVSWSQGGFKPNYGFPTGNLTFVVSGFSGYNVTDSVSPTITVNNPLANANLSQDPVIFNYTFNGTGTNISKANVTVGGSAFTLNNMSCQAGNNFDVQTCTFNTSLSDGNYSVNVSVWDFGGSDPGNSNNTVYNFTLDSTNPSVSNPAVNDSTVRAADSINVSVDATDVTTSLSDVNVTGDGSTMLAMSSGANDSYSKATTASALGCSIGNCTLTFRVKDSAGNLNSSTTTAITVIGETDGNGSNIKGNKNNLTVKINSSANLSSTYSGNQTVNITVNESGSSQPVVSFDFDFEKGSINFSSINVTEKIVGSDNTISVNGLDLSGQGNTKTVYFNKTASKNGVCIKDKANADGSGITSDCSGSDETELKCTTSGNTAGGYTCTDLGSRLKVEGLDHSAVRQTAVSTSSSSSTGSSGGGGGGGGSIYATSKASFAWLTEGVTKEILIDADSVNVDSIKLTPNKRVTDVTIEVSDLPSPNFNGDILDAFVIDNNVVESDLEGAEIEMKLGDEELDGVTPSDVSLYRLNENNGEWEKISTTFEEETNGYTFTASTPGFSKFVLGKRDEVEKVEVKDEQEEDNIESQAETEQIQESETIEEEQENESGSQNVKTTEQDGQGWYSSPLGIILWVFLALFIGGLAYYFRNSYDGNEENLNKFDDN